MSFFSMSIGDHSGPPCQDLNDHFPWVIVRQHNFIPRRRGEFQRLYNLQIFDFLQLISYN